MKLRIVHRPWLARPFVIEQEYPHGWVDLGASFASEPEARDAITQRKEEKVVEEFEL